jgi:hypothetical protein
MIARARSAGRLGTLAVVGVLLFTACSNGRAGVEAGRAEAEPPDERAGDTGAAESGDTGGVVDGQRAGEDDVTAGEEFRAPTPEDTTREAPAQVEIDPTTIRVATLPIGGSAGEPVGNLQCVDIGWSAPPEIPDGVTVVIEGLILEPDGHFAVSAQPCVGDAPTCGPGLAITPVQRCVAAVEWSGAAGPAGGSLRAAGTLVCEAEAAVCAGFADAVAARGGDFIELSGPQTGTTSSSDGADDPGDAPSGQGDAENDGGEEGGGVGGSTDGQVDADHDEEQNGDEGTSGNDEG